MSARKKSPSGSIQGGGAAIPQSVVFVLGPPRTGTSAISHVIETLGVYFGEHDRFIDPSTHRHNPLFFELQSVNDLNDGICEALGAGYSEFSLIPMAADYTDAVYERFAPALRDTIRDELGDHDVVGLKDPRFVFTLPFWRRAFEALGYRCLAVVTARDTEAAVRSNHLVNGFDDAHNRRIVRMSRLLSGWQVSTLPSLGIDFDAALERPLECVRRLAEHIGYGGDRVEQAASVLDRRHRHHGGATTGSPVDVSDDLAASAVEYGELVSGLERNGLLPLMCQLRSTRDALLAEMASQRQALSAVEQARNEAESRVASVLAGHLAVMAGTPYSGILPLALPKLYGLGPDGSFGEDFAVIGECFHTDVGELARFRVSGSMLSSDVRFDPDQAPGAYRILEATIDGRPVQPLSGLVMGVSGVPFKGQPTALITPTEDPWWRLKLPGEFLGSGEIILDLHFERMTWGDLTGYGAPLQEMIEQQGRCLDQLSARSSQDNDQLVSRIDEVSQAAITGRQAIVDALTRIGTHEQEISGMLSSQNGRIEGIGSQVAVLQERQQADSKAAGENIERLASQVAALQERQQADSKAAGENIERLASQVAALQVHQQADSRAAGENIERLASQTAALHERLGILIGFVQRRTFGYWWRRLFGGPK